MALDTSPFSTILAAFAPSAHNVLNDGQTIPRAKRRSDGVGENEFILSQSSVTLRQQDFGKLGLGRSAMLAQMTIGTKHYEHGLGTHSVSEILVNLPGPGKCFQADIGIDNNSFTTAWLGTVVFIVEIKGKEVFRSDVRRGFDPSLSIIVNLDGAEEFTLRVLDGGDGREYDYANWANASVTLEDGSHLWLDEMPVIVPDAQLSTDPPFSFVYDGKPSHQILSDWEMTYTRQPVFEGKELNTVTYTDPVTGLQLTFEATVFTGYSAVEWVLQIRNTSDIDTPIIEDILPLNLNIAAPKSGDIIFHHANGSNYSTDDYMPNDELVEADSHFQMAPQGGRSSNGALPFFNLEWNCGGLVGGIGWTGQWAVDLFRDSDSNIVLNMGQQKTYLKLHPGESIRTPRILLAAWHGDDRIQGHNLLRKIIYQHYTPLLNGKKPLPLVQCNTWFPSGDGGRVNERNQIELLGAYKPLDIEYMVMDDGWFCKTFATGLGTWEPWKEKFPNGLNPIGDAAKHAGIQFGLWFEPERAMAGSQLEKEHPDWLIKLDGNSNFLVNFGLPEVQQWFIELVSRYIEDVPLGYYRQDFNMDPLPYWHNSDECDRIGITEIRYVEGLYRVWDVLLSRYPTMMIEGCASGGRRIDLESICRCHTYWKSDFYGDSVANQGHVYGLSLYLPGNYLNTPLFELSDDAYALRSTFGGALCLGWDPRTEKVGAFPRTKFDLQLAIEQVNQFKLLRHLFVGDFYPLTDFSLREKDWIGYQFHRGDLDEGVVVLFRHSKSSIVTLDVKLYGLSIDDIYEVQLVDSDRVKHASGRDLSESLRITIDSVPGSTLVTYRNLSIG